MGLGARVGGTGARLRFAAPYAFLRLLVPVVWRHPPSGLGVSVSVRHVAHVPVELSGRQAVPQPLEAVLQARRAEGLVVQRLFNEPAM